MLELKEITKNYLSGEQTVHALKGIDIVFRDSEFVSILGPSGCGKTTLLNIVGGLDRYTSGDLIINGKSTKKFKDKDWDAYRNHSVGFVFQNYNLIPHQTVLANVELSLTLSGISKRERRKRAKKVLEDVGLLDQINKKPNQLSGGQMQRVAIARALVNDPDIILADEPTGALDTETSVQIMEILKKISNDKLIIMVTHNPDLAEKYSSRIVKAIDGKIISDSNPVTDKEKESAEMKFKTGKTSMKFLTALSLSLNNLMTKKGRTFLTAFAGSIGIIGIALILSLSNGVQKYIDKLQQDTLSSYPITIEEESFDMASMLTEAMTMSEKTYDDDRVHVYSVLGETMSMISSQVKINNLKEFKKFVETNETIKENSSDIQYGYDIELYAYKEDTSNGIVQVNPSTMSDIQEELNKEAEGSDGTSLTMSFPTSNVWVELMNNQELLENQYDVKAGNWPQNENEVVLVLSEDGKITDYTLYVLGFKEQKELRDNIEKIKKGEKIETEDEESFAPEDFVGTKYKVLLNTDFYVKNGTRWEDKSSDEAYMKEKLAKSKEVTIVGVIEPKGSAASTSTSLALGGIGYKKELTDYIINNAKEQEIAKEQLANEKVNVFTGLEFISKEDSEMSSGEGLELLSPEQQMSLMSMSPSELSKMIEAYTLNVNATYKDNLKKLGVCEADSPSSISIYPKDFESKDRIAKAIEDYNQKCKDEGREDDVIAYSDMLELLMSSVTKMVNMISYVLIAFVAISLIVSSIMIGIITYISVLERIKEIGILRAIGASKRDISRVFNAETIIVGFGAGLIGIGISLLLLLPINLIIKNVAKVDHLAKMPFVGAIVLIAISMILTTIAGLIPSKVASKKDPVEALRSE